MEKLARVMVEALVIHYGRAEFLRRLAHPFWFQSFGAVMGMDWHSSGITTAVCSALKRGLAPIQDEIGIYVCGGRGKHSLQTPKELERVCEKTGLCGSQLARTSRLVAKVDNTAVQDGFQIYLHSFFLTSDGLWTVVQQGMDEQSGMARRYHWLSSQVRDFVDEPHAAIEGLERTEPILNLTDHRASDARESILDLVQRGPDQAIWEIRDALHCDALSNELPLLKMTPQSAQLQIPHLTMPRRHQVISEDVNDLRLRSTLVAAEQACEHRQFDELLLTPGLGPRTMASLAFVSEVLHGKPSRFSDPARFSLCHGGKDGHPFPVPLHIYDQTISVLKNAVRLARLGEDDKLEAIRRLDQQARKVEEVLSNAGQNEPIFADYLAAERQQSRNYGGRTVFDRPNAQRAQTARKPTSHQAASQPARRPQTARKPSPHCPQNQPFLPGF